MDIIAELEAAVGPGGVLTGEAVRERHAGLWSQRRVEAKALVRPSSTEEVSAVLAICNAHCQSVVAHGGLTGLVKSASTSEDDVVLSLERHNRIEAINVADRTMVVQSGVILQVLQEAAEEHGLMFPLDLGARGSCTIGGNIATNAGGNRVIRYGMTRDMVLGLEAVLADGTVVSSMNQMIKNNAGYDLKQLFIGTEGSLGVVTKAVLRLREMPTSRATLLVAVDEFDKLGGLLRHLDRALGGSMSAFEVMWNNFYTLVTTPPAENQAPIPRDYPYYVLIEVIGSSEDLVEEAMSSAFETDLIVDAVLAQSEAQRQQLWSLRDSVEHCSRYGPVFSFDVSMRLSQMHDYIDEVNKLLNETYSDFHNFTFGHMGDGNLHLAVSVGERDSQARQQVERCVYEPLGAIRGSVSAEHGVGLEKKPYLHLSRSAEEVALMRKLKSALDPRGILNPGKIFDPAPAP